MSYGFYVLEGKKLIDYKPTEEHYKRAFIIEKGSDPFVEIWRKWVFIPKLCTKKGISWLIMKLESDLKSKNQRIQ